MYFIPLFSICIKFIVILAIFYICLCIYNVTCEKVSSVLVSYELNYYWHILTLYWQVKLSCNQSFWILFAIKSNPSSSQQKLDMMFTSEGNKQMTFNNFKIHKIQVDLLVLAAWHQNDICRIQTHCQNRSFWAGISLLWTVKTEVG